MYTFLFLVLLASCDSEDVKVVARAGENATLPCLVPKHLQGTPVENLTVTWSTLEQSQLCSSRNATSECKEDVKDRVKMVNLDLVIANVSLSDQKLYSCTVKRGGDRKVVNDVKLLVENSITPPPDSTSTPTSSLTLDYHTTLEPDQTNTTAANTSSTTTSDSNSIKTQHIGVAAAVVFVIAVGACYIICCLRNKKVVQQTVEDCGNLTTNGGGGLGVHKLHYTSSVSTDCQGML